MNSINSVYFSFRFCYQETLSLFFFSLLLEVRCIPLPDLSPFIRLGIKCTESTRFLLLLALMYEVDASQRL